MKKNINTLIFLLYLTPCFAQNIVPTSTQKVHKIRNTVFDQADIVLDGRYITYYNGNNVIMYEANYKKGVLDGVSKFYYRSGKLFSEQEYKEGVLHGFYKEYYEAGGIREYQSYKNGKKHGEFKEYYPSGKLLKKTLFVDGAFQSSYFYTEFNQEYLIGEKGMFYAKKTDKEHLPTFLYNHFKKLSYELGENEGNVYLKITIDTEGVAKDLRLVNIKKNQHFIKATKAMYKLSKKLPLFIPAKKDGVPLESTVLILLQKSLPTDTQVVRYNNTQRNNPYPNSLNSRNFDSYPYEMRDFLLRHYSPSYPREGGW